MKQKMNNDYLVELHKRIEKVVKEENALNVIDLKIDGKDIMKALKIKPGPKVGKILNELLEAVLDDPKINSKAKLLELVRAYK